MLEVPKDGEVYRFQEGMAEQLIAQYWHCSWIDLAVHLSEAGDLTGALAAAETSLAWTDLPSVSTQSANRASVAESTVSANEASRSVQPWWVDEKNLICGSMAEVSR